ncbi:MAG: hypothetical protein KAI22_10960 [Gammaproteobacteria bacterium]|nr:hypothetical protein [Gammaproteobacteria bacterium]
MDELIFLLILAGIGVVLLVAMFTYYKHHKKIHDEIKDFNYHTQAIDDVLLNDRTTGAGKNNNTQSDNLFNDDLPSSFSASRQDHFDINDIHLKHDSFADDQVNSSPGISSPVENKTPDKGELIDGVYINSKRVISNFSPEPVFESTPTQAPEPEAINPFAHFQNKTKSAAVTGTDEQRVESQPAMNRTSTMTNPVPDKQPEAPAAEQPVITDKPHSDTYQSQKSSQTATQKIKVVYDPLPQGVEELIISHAILSKGEHFTGRQLFHALETAGLFYGDMDIFHYPGSDEAETFALFSVANAVEPGTFKLQDEAALKTPGITMFMRLPTRTDSYSAYEKFIQVAQMIASELNAELCDETRSQLTRQTISYKKEQIRKLNFDMAKAEKLAGSTR